MTGHLLTEDEGRLLSVFPGSERLRYTDPVRRRRRRRSTTWRKIAEEHPDAVVVFGDDGEKFGTWPETKKHVYDDGWLVRFFDALVQNQDWIQVTTLAEAFDNVPPVGKIYLPDCSYREMTEWALPTEQLVEYERIAARDAERSALAVAAAVRARRVLAELQGEVSRSRRDVLPHDDGQPPLAGDRRRRPRPATRSTPNWSSRPAPNSTAASATAATGTGRSAASTCRTCATPSTST